MNLIRQKLGSRIITIVGLMGAGKSRIGYNLSKSLDIPFVDSDNVIEETEGLRISEIFSEIGEDYFRDREQKIIAELLSNGPKVLATGGGAFMNPDTRKAVKNAGIVLWLNADLEVLMNRLSKDRKRPLLQSANPEETIRKLISARYPVYAEADIEIESKQVPIKATIDKIVEALCIELKIQSSKFAINKSNYHMSL